MKARVGVPAVLAFAIALGGQVLAGPLEDGQAAAVRGNYSAALQDFRPLAESGDPTAQYELGRLFAGGHGVAEDYALAASWFRKAAEQGNRNAQLLLALMYARGQGVPQDDKQGWLWVGKATAGMAPGYRDNATRLYVITRGSFDHGGALSPEQIAARALPTLRASAEQGNAGAQYNLALMYERGQGVPIDEPEAAFWYRKAADQGIVMAQRALGAMYREGRGVKKDQAQADFWLDKAGPVAITQPPPLQIRPVAKPPN